jgi:CRP-like cAMP-binding protein
MENFKGTFRTVVFKEGSKANKLYVVRTGEVLCLKSSKERLIPIFMAKEGDIIGESAILDNVIHTYSAICMGPVELIEVSSFSFKQVMNNAPSWIHDLMTTMILRFQDIGSLISENRIVHSKIISEDYYNAKLENEFKKLLN